MRLNILYIRVLKREKAKMLSAKSANNAKQVLCIARLDRKESFMQETSVIQCL